jgi:hypothetical protein
MADMAADETMTRRARELRMNMLLHGGEERGGARGDSGIRARVWGEEAVIREYIKKQEQEGQPPGSNESVALIGHLQVAQQMGAASAPLQPFFPKAPGSARGYLPGCAEGGDRTLTQP